MKKLNCFQNSYITFTSQIKMQQGQAQGEQDQELHQHQVESETESEEEEEEGVEEVDEWEIWNFIKYTTLFNEENAGWNREWRCVICGWLYHPVTKFNGWIHYRDSHPVRLSEFVHEFYMDRLESMFSHEEVEEMGMKMKE